MHELSVAVSIVDIAQEEAIRLNARVCAVHLKLGVLAGVSRDALLFSYDVACEDTPLEGSRLLIQDMPLIVYCPQCRTERVLATTQAFCCEVCGTPTPEVIGGREMELCGLEVEE